MFHVLFCCYITDTTNGGDGVSFNENCDESELKPTFLLQKIEKEFKKDGYYLTKCKFPVEEHYLESKQGSFIFEMEFSYFKSKKSTSEDVVMQMKLEQLKYKKDIIFYVYKFTNENVIPMMCAVTDIEYNKDQHCLDHNVEKLFDKNAKINNLYQYLNKETKRKSTTDLFIESCNNEEPKPSSSKLSLDEFQVKRKLSRTSSLSSGFQELSTSGNAEEMEIDHLIEGERISNVVKQIGDLPKGKRKTLLQYRNLVKFNEESKYLELIGAGEAFTEEQIENIKSTFKNKDDELKKAQSTVKDTN